MHRLWIVIVIAACGSPHDSVQPDAQPLPDAAVAPVFRNPVGLPDDQLATQALKILGANVPGSSTRCNNCHGMTRQRVRYWRALSDTSMSSCLTDLSLADAASAQKTIDCIRTMPGLATSDFQTQKLGVYATAARLPWFQFAFWRAYGDDAQAQLTAFQDQVAMPKGDVPQLTQDEFDIVAEWFARGVPMLDDTLPIDPAPSTCTPGISADVAAHVQAMSTQGWRAVNRDNMMAMYDCGTETDPKLCLADKPLAADQTYGAAWDVTGQGHLRILDDVTYASSYWTRSSPDGRFVAHGVDGTQSSYIVDMQRGATVTIAAQYDPAFFPDNTGFVFQGGTRNVCGISVLTSNPTNITTTEAACAKISTIGLYQHVGRGLNNGDYFAIDSQFESDDGGKDGTNSDPAASFTTNGYTDFTPMIFDGTKYVTKGRIHITQPFEGDSSLSPSARLEMTRVAGPNEKQIGYVLHKVVATPSGANYAITTPEIARYCMSGGKPGFSYDERWIAFHHYESNGSSNLYLMDLRTGTPIKITNMSAGQYALYPHFRSDGWIYARVRDANSGHEYTIASDAALLAE